MKTITLLIRRSLSVGGLFAILFAAGLNSSLAQDTWTQKTDFGGTARSYAAGFSIGSKGYIGTGYDGANLYKDFWEYDPATNAWTQKADFGGAARNEALGFSIGNKGYIGTGSGTDGWENDFWEYDPATNAWTQKANFGGTARHDAVGFSIGDKGYIGTGRDLNLNYTSDFWEYDPTTDDWTQKADFGGIAREAAVGFSIGSKGYIGTGYTPSSVKDFWEYDPTTNAWTQKANFGGSARYWAIGFSIGSKGYIGTGTNNYSLGVKKDFWEYDPASNKWTQKADFGGTARFYGVPFSIDSKGYIGTGVDTNGTYLNDLWEYIPDTSSCAVPTNLSATNITSTSAKLNWDAVAGAEGYSVRYKVAGSAWKMKTTNNNSKIISGLLPNTSYEWEVKTFCHIAPPRVKSDWSSKQEFTTGTLRMGDESLQQISFQIYPNPAEDHATIQFTLQQSSHVCIKVYDVSGKEIETLLNDVLQQGDHSVQLNTNHFSKGVYMVKMISDFGIENQKLMVL